MLLKLAQCCTLLTATNWFDGRITSESNNWAHQKRDAKLCNRLSIRFPFTITHSFHTSLPRWLVCRPLSAVHTSNNVQATLSNGTSWTILSTMSKQIEHVQFVSTLSKGRNFTIESFDIVAVCGNKVECCFDKVERCFDNVACCFDIVAGVDGANTASLGLIVFRNRLKTFLFHHTPFGCPAD